MYYRINQCPWTKFDCAMINWRYLCIKFFSGFKGEELNLKLSFWHTLWSIKSKCENILTRLFMNWKWLNFSSKIDQFAKKSTFLHLLLQSLKIFGGNIDQKFFYHQLEQEKLFNLITNFMQIGPSKATKYWNLWKMSKLPLKLKPQFSLQTLSSLKCSQI